MSVINNVLKGLDKRESQFTPIEISAIDSIPVTAADHRPRFVLGIVVLLLLAAGGYYLLDNRASEFGLAPDSISGQPAPVTPAAAASETAPVASRAATTVPAPAAPAPQPAVIAAAATDNQIIGLQIRESESEMRIEFVLRERVVAYLKERGENIFSYHLSDVDSQIVAPLIRDNRWIRGLEIEQSTVGVDVKFATAEDILVETRQQSQDDTAVWVITLYAAQPAEPPVAFAPAIATTQPAVAAAQPPAIPDTPVEVTVEQVTPAPVKIDIKSTTPVAKTANQLEYAVELMNSRRPDDAEKLLRGLFGGSHDYQARQHLLVLYSRLKQPTRMQSLLEASLLAYPADALFQTEYGRLLYQRAAYRKVIALYTPYATLTASQQALLAASYQRLDQHAEAIRYYKLALVQDSANARNWIGLGISQEYSSEFDAALASFQQAIKSGGLSARLLAFVETRSDRLKQVIN